MFDFSHIVYKGDMRYFLIGVIIVAIFFVSWNQYGSVTGFITRGMVQNADLTIDDGTLLREHTIELVPGMTVFDYLKDLAYVDYKIYESEVEVTGINGLGSDVDFRWVWLVNGEFPDVPVDSYQPLPGDRISFRYVMRA